VSASSENLGPSKTHSLCCFQIIQGISSVAVVSPLRKGLGDAYLSGSSGFSQRSFKQLNFKFQFSNFVVTLII
jgi:hypothetical protein